MRPLDPKAHGVSGTEGKMSEGGPERHLKGGLVLVRHAKECVTPLFGPTFFHHEGT